MTIRAQDAPPKASPGVSLRARTSPPTRTGATRAGRALRMTALALALATSACSQAQASTASTAAEQPDKVNRPSSSSVVDQLRLQPVPGRPVLSLAATSSGTEHRLRLPASLRSALVTAALASHVAGDAVVTLTVPGRPVTALDLTPMRGGTVENVGNRRERAAEANVERLDALLSGASASTAGLDALGVADAAARGNGGAPIAVLSSGVSTAPPLDLRQWGWPERPDSVVNFLREHDYLPQHLSGRDVHFFYLGDVAGSQPVLPSSARTVLETLYRAICTAAGATACVIWDDPPSAEPSVGRQPVPVVPVPEWAEPTRLPPTTAKCTTIYDVPTSLLFTPDSAVLAGEAMTALRPLALRIVNARGRLVIKLVRGHTSDAGPGNGEALSQQRARRTAAALRELGVPSKWILRVDGVGESQQVAPDHQADGSPDPRAGLNRRVEIVIADTTCAP